MRANTYVVVNETACARVYVKNKIAATKKGPSPAKMWRNLFFMRLFIGYSVRIISCSIIFSCDQVLRAIYFLKRII